MRDAIVIAIVIAFFALAAGYVVWCERIVAADGDDIDHDPSSSPAERVAP